MPVNVHIDTSALPSWAIAVLIAGALAAELVTGEWHSVPKGLTVAECMDLCGPWLIHEWNPRICTCQDHDGTECEP